METLLLFGPQRPTTPFTKIISYYRLCHLQFTTLHNVEGKAFFKQSSPRERKTYVLFGVKHASQTEQISLNLISIRGEWRTVGQLEYKKKEVIY